MNLFRVHNIAYASYLSTASLRHAHSLLFSSDRNETKILRFPFWLNIFRKISFQIKTESYLKKENKLNFK